MNITMIVFPPLWNLILAICTKSSVNMLGFPYKYIYIYIKYHIKIICLLFLSSIHACIFSPLALARTSKMIFNNRYKVGSFLPFLKISELASSRFQKSKYHFFSHLPSFFFLKNEYLEFIQFLFGTKWAIIYGFFFEQKVTSYISRYFNVAL